MKGTVEYFSNALWDSQTSPVISVVMCVFNRREPILRAMQSVDGQTFRQIELIVVDNGSTTPVDDIIRDFLDKASIPMLFVKRSYGMGPMTGRNSGIAAARGKYIALLDDDDEYLPEAMQTLLAQWDCIPENLRDEYREVVGRCQDQNGKLIGEDFPDNINSLPWPEALAACHNSGSAHMALGRADVLKAHPFPEPEGVTMVSEGLLWEMLSRKYRSWYCNDVVYQYYLDSGDSYCHTAKKRNPAQVCINGMFNAKYLLEHWEDYDRSFAQRVKSVLVYEMYRWALKTRFGGVPEHEWAQKSPSGCANTLLRWLLYIPAFFVSMLYVAKKL